eukprot:5040482-Prorocentrum_lima.AAC.1
MVACNATAPSGGSHTISADFSFDGRLGSEVLAEAAGMNFTYVLSANGSDSCQALDEEVVEGFQATIDTT